MEQQYENTLDIPRNRIIAYLEKINTKKELKIVDMGCGNGEISKHFKNKPNFKFYNYDHVSSSDDIIACNIKDILLEHNSIDICILSLAMWGSDNESYIEKVLELLDGFSGTLLIIEPTKRWSKTDDDDHKIIRNTEGNKLKNMLQKYFINITPIFKNIGESVYDKYIFFECKRPKNI